MSKKLRELQAKKADAAKAKAAFLQAASMLLDKGASENRDLTDAEATEFAKVKADAAARGNEIDRIQAQIDIEQDLIAATAAAGSPASSPDLVAPGHRTCPTVLRAAHEAMLPGNGKHASAFGPDYERPRRSLA